MSDRLVTKEQLIHMFVEQEKLNKKYNGEDWTKGLSMGKAKAALLDEVSEFLRELEPEWKWWSGKAKAKTIDLTKALYELIDVVHFGLMIVLYRHDLQTIIKHLDNRDWIEANMYGEVDDPYDYFSQAINRFMSSATADVLDGMLINLYNIIETGGKILGDMYQGAIYDAYLEKNKLNHKRVEGGQLQGTYDKGQEVYMTYHIVPRGESKEPSGNIHCRHCNYGKHPCNEFCYGEDL